MNSIMPFHAWGELRPPPSKSLAQRQILLSLLARTPSLLSAPGKGDDVLAARKLAQTLGAVLDDTPDGRLRLQPPGEMLKADAELDCGESATLLRILPPLLCARAQGRVTCTCRGTLRQRPLATVLEAVRALGGTADLLEDGSGLTVQGPLRGGSFRLDGSQGSQALSGLLMTLPLLPGKHRLEVTAGQSLPYLHLTARVMRERGIVLEPLPDRVGWTVTGGQTYRGGAFDLEPDWSAAAFWVVAGCLSGPVCLHGLQENSPQGDRFIWDLAQEAGAILERPAPGQWVIRRGSPRPFEADLSQTPDLFPPAAILAAGASGTSRLRGTHRLRAKESDRAQGLVELLTRLGIEARDENDTLTILGKGRLEGGTIHARGDHRLAMAAAVAATLSHRPIGVEGMASISKSYPSFLEDLRLMGGFCS